MGELCAATLTRSWLQWVMIQLAHHINDEKLVTMGYDSTPLSYSSCSFISTKVSLDLGQVNSPSNAPLKFLGRFGVFENAELNT
jgi:hypothetical protein